MKEMFHNSVFGNRPSLGKGGPLAELAQSPDFRKAGAGFSSEGVCRIVQEKTERRVNVSERVTQIWHRAFPTRSPLGA